MDEFQSDNIDLLNFINKKCLDSDNTEPKKIFFLFTKSIRNAIICTYEQQGNLQYTLSCVDLIFNIFWIIYNYSYNAKLTMFMCERSVLLFNEYINISKTYGSDEINMSDVKQFIINKTIGPLKITERNDLNQIKHITSLAQVYRNFLYKLFHKVINSQNFYYSHNDFFESVSYILSNVLYKMDSMGFRDYVEGELDILINVDILDLPREVNILKIKLELFIYAYGQTSDYKLSKLLSTDILENYIHIIDELHDINEFFDCQSRIQDTEFFQKLILILKDSITNKQT